MKLFNRIMEDFMPARKRGTTKFVITNKVSTWNKYEVTDSVR